MNNNQKIELIKRNTVETITEKELKDLFSKKKKPSMYLGAAPTGKIHLGYFHPIIKIKDFIDSGFKAKFLLADIHAYLDDRKAPWKLTRAKSKYYKESIIAIMKAIGGDPKDIEFVMGSDVQRSKEYVMDLYKIMGQVSVKRSMRSSSEVVRQVANPDVGSLVYPLMQAIDPHHLDCDVALGGSDQRKIYMLAREELPDMGYSKPISVFINLVPSLKGDGGKMSASVKGSGIKLDASKEEIYADIKRAYCPEGITENNTILKIAEVILFPVNKAIKIERPEKFGGNIDYKDYATLEKDFTAKKLHPMDLKNAVAKDIDKLLNSVRKHFKNKQKIISDAHP